MSSRRRKVTPAPTTLSPGTLGISPMVTLTKRDIARAHVEEAIRLHLNGNALCAITLAGAAEAVLEGLVLDAGGTPVVDASIATIEKLRARGLNVMGKRSPKDMLSAWNLARNKLKRRR